MVGWAELGAGVALSGWQVVETLAWAASRCLYFGGRASAYAFQGDASSLSMTRSLHRTVTTGLSTAVSPRFLGSVRRITCCFSLNSQQAYGRALVCGESTSK